MKKIITYAASLALVLGVLSPSAFAQADPMVQGQSTNTVAQVGGSPAETIRQGADKTGTNTGNSDASTIIRNITNVLLFIIGAISVIMLIFGGIKYTTSNGDQGAVTSAKNTITYAVVGLVVAIFAYAIVDFVVKGLSQS